MNDSEQKPKTLRETMPREFMFPTYENSPSRKFADVEVVREYDATNPNERWPGKQKNVYHWVLLKNGYAIGWNENSSLGWSFPAVLVKKPD